MNTAVKLMMTWDIKPGQEKQYFSFITQELPNTLDQLGFKLTDAWYTVYGDWPQVSMSFVSDDLQTLLAFMTSEPWLDLKRRLLAYTEHYMQKIVPARGGFQL